MIEKDFADDDKAQKLISDAQKAFKMMNWEKVGSTASKITRLDTAPSNKVPRKELELRARNLRAFMKRVSNETDGLIRDLETHPMSWLKFIYKMRKRLWLSPLIPSMTKLP